MMVGGRGNRKGLESQDVCCRRYAADERLQKINRVACWGEASEMPCRLLELFRPRAICNASPRYSHERASLQY